ncbi:hypothetical protein C5167_023537 [Papaver somniferum]|uniref:Uncharacterized protein n=1 Tax=Papaver somniferum TaxID=3469 RepID=A0A4Y7JL09_PAPSO|nr:hypothetical protein C5167_023537 [Papaver somniferum]
MFNELKSFKGERRAEEYFCRIFAGTHLGTACDAFLIRSFKACVWITSILDPSKTKHSLGVKKTVRQRTTLLQSES